MQQTGATDRDLESRGALLRWAGVNKSHIKQLSNRVLAELRGKVFQSLEQHTKETHAIDSYMQRDHVSTVITTAVEIYIKTFFHRFATVHTERIIKQSRPSRRQKLTKTVLFYNE